MWANLTVDSVRVELGGADGAEWELPSKGVLEFDYVDWRLGLETSLRFELGRPADRRLASGFLERAAATEGEACAHARLDDAPYAARAADALPAAGVLRMVYVVTRPIKRIGVRIELDLAEGAQRELCLELWRRELTTGQESWAQASFAPPGAIAEAPLDHHKDWRFPVVRGGAPTANAVPRQQLR